MPVVAKLYYKPTAKSGGTGYSSWFDGYYNFDNSTNTWTRYYPYSTNQYSTVFPIIVTCNSDESGLGFIVEDGKFSGKWVKANSNYQVDNPTIINSTLLDITENDPYLRLTTSNNGGIDVGYIYSSTGAKSTSDRRSKEHIIDTTFNINKFIDDIKIKEFNYKGRDDLQVGLIAQDLREALPEKYKPILISGEETETSYLSINESKLIYFALLAIKEQKKQIDKLKAEIEELKQ